MVFLEAFFDDMEKLSAKAGFNIRNERRIALCNVPFLFLLFLVDCMLVCDHIHFV